MGGPLLEDLEGACVNAEANIQSFDISVPFEREDLEGFGSMHVWKEDEIPADRDTILIFTV